MGATKGIKKMSRRERANLSATLNVHVAVATPQTVQSAGGAAAKVHAAAVVEPDQIKTDAKIGQLMQRSLFQNVRSSAYYTPPYVPGQDLVLTRWIDEFRREHAV